MTDSQKLDKLYDKVVRLEKLLIEKDSKPKWVSMKVVLENISKSREWVRQQREANSGIAIPTGTKRYKYDLNKLIQLAA